MGIDCVHSGATGNRKEARRILEKKYRLQEQQEEEGRKKLDVHLLFCHMRDWRRVYSGMSLSLEKQFSIYKFQKVPKRSKEYHLQLCLQRDLRGV